MLLFHIYRIWTVYLGGKATVTGKTLLFRLLTSAVVASLYSTVRRPRCMTFRLPRFLNVLFSSFFQSL